MLRLRTFLFLLAILDRAERIDFDIDTPINLQDLALDMLTLAWYSHVYFKLGQRLIST
jgi:hypothetical protein